MRERCWSRQLWESGYFVRTVGDKVTGEIVRRYIRRYIQRHRDNALVTGEDDLQLDLPDLF